MSVLCTNKRLGLDAAKHAIVVDHIEVRFCTNRRGRRDV